MTKIIVHKPSHSILIPHNQEVLDTIPKSKPFEYQGKRGVQVYHGLGEVAKLRELGYEDAPSPIKTYYSWPKVKGRFDPFNHQILTAEFLTIHPRGLVLSTMGTGKTESTLYAADYLIKTGSIKHVLILSPLSCIQKVWADAIFASFHWNSHVIMHGSADKRKEGLSQDVQFYIANHDFVKTAVLKYEERGVAKYKLKPEYTELSKMDAIVVDEYSIFRNGQTMMFHALETILNYVKPAYFWPLTGTPCPTAPTDAWALARLVNPDAVPKYFGTFRKQVMMQISSGPFPKWVPQKDSHEIVHKVLQPAIRFKKEDCIDLPPLTYQNRECELTAEQKTYYKSMRKELTMTHDDHEITAVNAADRLIKLRQILCGAIKADEDEYIPLDCAPRINLLLEIIEEAGHKVIVVVPYKGILRMLKKEISKHYTCEIVNGDTPVKERNRIFTEFQETRDPHVIAIHPKVASHGLNLTAANYVVFFGPIDSNDLYEQVCERIPRPGQKNAMSIVHIGSNSLEWDIYRGLQEKKSFQGMALELYKKELA